MTAPLIYMSTWKIKDGRLEDFKAFTHEFVAQIEKREPHLIAFHVFLNEDETEMTSIQVHPDPASMDSHLKVVDRVLGEDMNEWVERADFVVPKAAQVFGQPSADLLEADKARIESGIPYALKPRHLTGFTHGGGG